MTIFFITFVVGITAHGMLIFNKLAVHDDLTVLTGPSTVGLALSLGRWMGAILIVLDRYIFGFPQISTSTFYGFLAFLYIAIILCICTKLLKLENLLALAILSSFAVTSPTILMLFGYIHFVPFYFPGALFACMGSYVLCTYNHSIRNFFIGTILLCAGTAVYQSFFPFAISLLVLHLINMTEEYELSWNSFYRNTSYFLGSCFVTLLLYLIINYCALLLARIFRPSFSLTSYKGISTLGITTLEGYLNRCIQAYKYFIISPFGKNTMYAGGGKIFYYTFLSASFYLILQECFYLYKKVSSKTAIQFFILTALLPLFINLLYVMAGEYAVSSLNTFSYIVFVFFIIKRLQFAKNINHKTALKNIILASLICLSVISARFNDACYVKLDIVFSETKEYLSTLASRIKNTKDYKDEFPIVYVNERKKQDKTIPELDIDDLTHILPYKFTATNLINNYNWQTFMSIWCGYEPNVLSDDTFHKLPEVIQMPNYPDDGSIRIINDTVVVKF